MSLWLVNSPFLSIVRCYWDLYHQTSPSFQNTRPTPTSSINIIHTSHSLLQLIVLFWNWKSWFTKRVTKHDELIRYILCIMANIESVQDTCSGCVGEIVFMEISFLCFAFFLMVFASHTFPLPSSSLSLGCSWRRCRCRRRLLRLQHAIRVAVRFRFRIGTLFFVVVVVVICRRGDTGFLGITDAVMRLVMLLVECPSECCLHLYTQQEFMDTKD